MDKMLKFYVKDFMWWARCCQVSYPVRGHILLLFFCSRKFDVSVEKNHNVMSLKKLMEHGKHCLPCFNTNNLLP